MFAKRLCLKCIRVAAIASLLVCSTALLDQSLTAQDNVPVFQSKVRVVLVDVVVTDGKGTAVSGLQVKDFRLLENGKPQKVASFEEHTGPVPSQFTIPPMPPHVYTNFPRIATTDSLNVVLVDMLNTRLPDQSYVRDQIIKYLTHIQPGARLAIFALTTHLQLVQSFTTDYSGVLAALTAEKASGKSGVSMLLPTTTHLSSSVTSAARVPAGITAGDGGDMRDMVQMQLDERIQITLRALQQLGRYLSGMRGRKNLIWFAGSFPVTVLPNTDPTDPYKFVRAYTRDLEDTADQLTAGQVALYPIHSEGLVVGSANMHQTITLLTNSQLNMEELAKETGGEAFFNTNGLGNAMVDAIDNGSHYYSLSYSPENQSLDGKFRRIEIKLDEKKYKLSYRRGYYAEQPTTETLEQKMVKEDPLIPLMQFGMPEFSEIFYKVRVDSTDKPTTSPIAGSNQDLTGPMTRVGVDFAFPVDAFDFEIGSDGVRRGRVEWRLVGYGADGKPLNLVVRQSDVALNPQQYASSQKIGLQLHEDIDLPKADSYIYTGVFDRRSGAAGTLNVRLDKPAAKGTH